ncbi:hypothetical protein F4677DRAFT_418615 [Hypoxylon crocopeplum]|nr:hypothetical protein F4677DRAFT_418615 [Hypoxylon crocopeplum]
MNNYFAIKWTGRIGPRLFSGSQAARLKSSQLITRSQRCQTPSHVAPFLLSLNRQSFSSLPAQRSSEPQNPPTGELRTKRYSKEETRRQLILFNLAGIFAIVVMGISLKGASSSNGSDKKAVMNQTSFSSFTITSKEQVSPTAFVMSVRAGGASDDRSAGLLKEAWEHGLWSVEIKQPQLQIARHYTPLPPLSQPETESESQSAPREEELRFLIRKVDGGEMSTYLGKLRVGDEVWLRGPHLGFDVDRRLGAAKDVVFLAGGTGIAPALQVARKLLDCGSRVEEKPTISILWANRRAADALGREQQRHHLPTSKNGWFFSNWWRGTAPPSTDEKNEGEDQGTNSSLTLQIHQLRQKHPKHFNISYFVDEEGSVIRLKDLHAVLHASTPPPQLLPARAFCPWHSATALESIPDENDAERRGLECVCARDVAAGTGPRPGANLICVSGPDGFIEAYAGPKRWHAGSGMQGPVLGMLGRVLKDGEAWGNWLVLKL